MARPGLEPGTPRFSVVTSWTPLRLAGVKAQVRAILEADGVVERIGADLIYGNVHAALEAQLAEVDAAGRVVAVDGTRDSRLRPTIDAGDDGR